MATPVPRSTGKAPVKSVPASAEKTSSAKKSSSAKRKNKSNVPSTALRHKPAIKKILNNTVAPAHEVQVSRGAVNSLSFLCQHLIEKLCDAAVELSNNTNKRTITFYDIKYCCLLEFKGDLKTLTCQELNAQLEKAASKAPRK